MCAGLTTFNALRNSGARPGDLVAVLGLGGLGHLAVQYAARMGFRTAAIARGKDKEPLARQLGAARNGRSQAARRFGWSGPYGEEFAPDKSASAVAVYQAEPLT